MKFKKIKGDASDREFFRSRNSILIFSKKNKFKNLLVYDCINKILNNHKIPSPKLCFGTNNITTLIFATIGGSGLALTNELINI